VLLFVLHLEPVDELLKALESVANEPLNLKHHPVYIRLALQMQDGREMAADAAVSAMASAVPATNGNSHVYQACIKDLITICLIYGRVGTITVAQVQSYHTRREHCRQCRNVAGALCTNQERLFFVSSRSPSTGIIRIDMDAISNSDSQTAN
jgi:hypothetical protein